MVLVVIVAVQLMFGIDATVMTVALPSVGRDLGLDVAAQSWVQSGYVVAFGGLLLLGARLGDVLGRRRMVFGAARRHGTDFGAAVGAAMAGALVLEALVLVLAAGRLRWDRPVTPAPASTALTSTGPGASQRAALRAVERR